MNRFLDVKLKLEDDEIITTKELIELGVDKSALSRWVSQGKLERIARGIYTFPETLVDNLYVLQLRCKLGVFSHETALYMHGLSDRTPLDNVMTVPSGYNVDSFKNDPVTFKYIDKKFIKLGTTKMKTSYGHEVMVYDLERTICDIIRNRESMDKAIVNAALREYQTLKRAKPAKLSIYARKLEMQSIISKVMGVLY